MSDPSKGPFYDAHNHLQDERLRDDLPDIMQALPQAGVRRMVVNATRPSDWPLVLNLARQHSSVVPCFGVHPWQVKNLEPSWFTQLEHHVDQVPAGLGEIGLDRWVKGHDLALQEEVFLRQWRLAAARNIPVTIHCLRAWGRLRELLASEPGPEAGFLLHSYGGPMEMVDSLTSLGAYFSISGYFAHERKGRQRDVFGQISADRLLVETDAPDMWPPEKWNRFPLADPSTGSDINNPLNLGAIYEFVAELRGVDLRVLVRQVEENFQRLFGKLEVENGLG